MIVRHLPYFRVPGAGVVPEDVAAPIVIEVGYQRGPPSRVVALQEGGVYDVSPDGTRVVMLAEGETRVQLVVTANWVEQLRAHLEASK